MKKKMIFNIDEAIHTDIKKISAEKHMTMTNWILEIIIKQLQEEKNLGFEVKAIK